MTQRRNWHRRIATQKAKQARSERRAEPARRQVEQMDHSTTRAAAAKKPKRRGFSGAMKKLSPGRRVQVVQQRGTKKAPRGSLR